MTSEMMSGLILRDFKFKNYYEHHELLTWEAALVSNGNIGDRSAT